MSYRVAATAVLAPLASLFVVRSPEDRLNLPLVIAPQARTVVRVAMAAVEAAPAVRPMDLSRVANVMFFGRKGDAPGELHLSRFGLE